MPQPIIQQPPTSTPTSTPTGTPSTAPTSTPSTAPSTPSIFPLEAPSDMTESQDIQMTPTPLTQRPPYSQMQDIISDIVELYHNEIRNLNMYQSLLEISPNMEEEEIIEGIIDHTNNNILYLGQMHLGLTGETIDNLAMPVEEFPNLSYIDLLKNTLFSKTDTLEQYEMLYRLIPIQPYKDVLFEIIICQLKDATSSNYLISIQSQV